MNHIFLLRPRQVPLLSLLTLRLINIHPGGEAHTSISSLILRIDPILLSASVDIGSKSISLWASPKHRTLISASLSPFVFPRSRETMESTFLSSQGLATTLPSTLPCLFCFFKIYCRHQSLHVNFTLIFGQLRWSVQNSQHRNKCYN